MDRADLAQLLEALRECRKMASWPDVVRYAKKGLARLWIHLVLERGLDPRKAAPACSKGHQAVLKPYLEAGFSAGLGDRAELAWEVQEVAELASGLWDQAKASQSTQRASQAPLLGLEPDPSTPLNPKAPR